MGSRSTFTRKTHSSSARAADTTNDFADVHHAKKLKVNEIEKYQETTDSYISILDSLDFEYIEDAIASVDSNGDYQQLTSEHLGDLIEITNDVNFRNNAHKVQNIDGKQDEITASNRLDASLIGTGAVSTTVLNYIANLTDNVENSPTLTNISLKMGSDVNNFTVANGVDFPFDTLAIPKNTSLFDADTSSYHVLLKKTGYYKVSITMGLKNEFNSTVMIRARLMKSANSDHSFPVDTGVQIIGPIGSINGHWQLSTLNGSAIIENTTANRYYWLVGDAENDSGGSNFTDSVDVDIDGNSNVIFEFLQFSTF
jgi:hypothetical protein